MCLRNTAFVCLRESLFRNQNSDDVQIYFAEASGIRASQSYTAQYIDIHPSFRFNVLDGTIEYDVALIQVQYKRINNLN